MPAAQAVQAVNKAYVDQSVHELTQSLLSASGGSLTGPLFLNGDPTQSTQAATKHYVDSAFNQAVPMSGGALTGPLTSVQLGAAYQVDQFSGADFGAKLQSCLNALDGVYGGTCDARNFTGNLSMGSNLILSKANATVQLPCATISTASQIQLASGTRNVALHGCALRGASAASGSQGGTVLMYSGIGAAIQIGDSTYATDTLGFHLDNAVVNTTGSTSSSVRGLVAYRTQEIDLVSLYFLGNSNQVGMTLDGTGNYTGGTFQDIEFGGFGTAVNAIGHQTPNSAVTDWVNASTFLRLHIDCPLNAGSPITGTYGINLQQGDGNTFTGGDIEGCSTALHLGPNAQNNTIVGLRNENSINQVVADAGSSYNNWISGGTMFTGQLTDNGTRNSFLDTFHRSFNGLNGDWYGSQSDTTVTNHFRLGTGSGNERGMLNRYQTDFGYRWTMGLSDATAGEQFYQVLDELNNVYRLSIGQYNNGQTSTNNQTVINAAGAGAIVLNGSTNAGTGGVVFGSGGPSGSTVATINNAGNAQFNGSLQVGGTSTFTNSTTVKNQADAEIDSFLWAGTTASQKESFTYKDYTGASQWYMVKDASNNWALNSATGGLDSFKAYQSTNSGDTYINASNASGTVRVNYETGAGASFNIYGGNSSSLYAGFSSPTAIKFPGLAASSGHNCLQIDNSGYLSNTGSNCGTGSGSGTVNSGITGQIAYYNGSGTAVSGMSSVPLSAGGTGATTAAAALSNLGAQAALPGVNSDGASGVQMTGNVSTGRTLTGTEPVFEASSPAFNSGTALYCNGYGSGKHDMLTAVQNALNAHTNGGFVRISITGTATNPCYISNPASLYYGPYTLKGTWSGVTNTITLADITAQQAVVVGYNVTGTNIPAGTTVTAVSATSFTISNNTTGAGTNVTLTFSQPSSAANNSAVDFQIAGPVYIGSSWYTPPTVVVSFEGNGGTPPNGLNPSWRQGEIVTTNTLGSMTGTLGVAVSGSFTAGANATIPAANQGGLVTNDYATITDPVTCNISTIVRKSNLVTVYPSASCHIAPGSWNYTISGVADSSFNTTIPTTLLSNDFNNNVQCPYCMTYNQTAADSVSSGGTITGVNYDTAEAVGPFTCVSGVGCSATFFRNHGSTASWSIDGVVVTYAGSGPSIKDMTVYDNYGSPLDYQNADETLVTNSLVQGCQPTSIDHSGYPNIEHSTFFQLGCGSRSDLIPWGIHYWNRNNTDPGNVSGFMKISGSWIGHAIMMDHGAHGLVFDNSVLEVPHTGAIVFDGTYSRGFGVANVIQISYSEQQDTAANPNLPWVYYPYPGTSEGQSTSVWFNGTLFNTTFNYVNSYFDGSLHTFPGTSTVLRFGDTYSPNILGTYDDGKTYAGPWDGSGAGMGLQSVPFPTANIAQNPTSWNTAGGLCTINAGGINPIGQQDSMVGAILSNGNCNSSLGNLITSATPHLGDAMIFGGWEYTPDWGQQTGSAGGFSVTTSINGHVGISSQPFIAPATPASSSVLSRIYDSKIYDQGWHQNAGIAFVTYADGTGGQTISMYAVSGTSGKIIDFWGPRAIYVSSVNFTANTDGSTGSLTSVSAATCTISGPNCALYPGQEVYGTGIALHSYITAVSGSTITLNQATTATGTGVSLYAQVPMRELYRWRTYLLAGSTPSNFNGQGIAATNQPVAAKGYYNLNPSGGAPNSIIPSTVTGYNGNSSGVDIPLSVAWNTPSSITGICHDANGNITDTGCPGGTGVMTSTMPGWLQNIGNGQDGANTNASGILSCNPECYYTNFTVPYGNTVTANGTGLVIHVSGTATIAGTIATTGNDGGAGAGRVCGGASGGSGGGTAAGTNGTSAIFDFGGGGSFYAGGAGAASGGNASNAQQLGGPPLSRIRECLSTGSGSDGVSWSGSPGLAGGSSGGARGQAGTGLVIIANSFVGTDGTHIGIINASGTAGTPAAANNTGSGSGGGAAPVVISSLSPVTTWPTVFVQGGPGALSNGVSQPTAYLVNDTCQAFPKVSLTTSSGALSSCTVQAAGTNCSGLGTFTQLGTGGGSGGTITPTWQTATPTGTWSSGSLTLTVSSAAGIVAGMAVTGAGIPSSAYVTKISGTTVTISNYTTASGSGTSLTFTGGALQSCTATGGSGYQANVTYTTSGNGADSADAWVAFFAAGAQVR